MDSTVFENMCPQTPLAFHTDDAVVMTLLVHRAPRVFRLLGVPSKWVTQRGRFILGVLTGCTLPTPWTRSYTRSDDKSSMPEHDHTEHMGDSTNVP